MKTVNIQFIEWQGNIFLAKKMMDTLDEDDATIFGLYSMRIFKK